MQDAVKMAQAPLNVKWLERFFALKTSTAINTG